MGIASFCVCVCAEGRLMWNAGRASNDSAPPGCGSLGLSPWWGWRPSIAGRSPSPVCHGPSISSDDTNIAIIFLSLETSTEKSACYRLCTRSSVNFLESLCILGKPSCRRFWSGSLSSVVTSSTQTRTHSQGGSSCAMALPSLCSGSNHLLSNYSRFHLPFPYVCLTTGIRIYSCRIPLFHANNQQCEAVT